MGDRQGGLASVALLTGMILTGCLISIVDCRGALAEPVVSRQHTYYSVDGLTAPQIRNALERSTPVRHDGNLFDAYTRWDVQWRFNWTFDGKGVCRITTVSTTVRIHQTLPRLQANRERPPDVTKHWNRYLTALTAHEEGHIALAIDAAREIERQLAQLPERPSCKQLESDANDRARQIISRYTRLEDQFDAESDHGARSGARFP